MNLYKLHSKPEQLDHYDEQWKMPEKAWNLITKMHYADHKDTRHLAKYIKYLPYKSYIYARDIMNGERFYEAEPYILQEPVAAASYYRWIIGAEYNDGGDDDVSWPEADKFYDIPGNNELYRKYHQHIENWT